MSYNKQSLRTLLKQTRQIAFDRFDAHSGFVQEDLSKNITSLLSDIDHKQLTIGGYCEMGSEFPFSLLKTHFSEWADKKDIAISYAYPYVDQQQVMCFIAVDGDNGFQQTDFGFKQPLYDVDNIVKPDVILVPALGFDYAGNRLGYGKGHYDRYFASLDNHATMRKIGLTYAHIVDEISLKVDALPKDPHDVSMDYILTEAGVYKTHLTLPS